MLLPGPILGPRYVPRQAGGPHDLLHRVVRENTMGVRAIVRTWETAKKLLAVLGRPWQPDLLVPRPAPAVVTWEEDADFW